ncbi:MAG: PAS domain-containing protein, partial [Pseudomonadota bacterium]
MLFLNELRHQAGTALSLSLPMSRDDLPATRAVLGQTGAVEGRDYRGVPVIADVRPIPNSPWFLVAKVDRDEAFAEINRHALQLALLVGSLILFVVAALGLVYRQRHASLLQAMLDSERQRALAQHSLRTTLYSIGDAVIATDREGRVQVMNPVAENLTGWREDEARGRSLEEVFDIFTEATRARVESPVQRVLRDGAVVGLANHTLLRAR